MKFKSKYNRNKNTRHVKVVSLFDAVYSKQNAGISLNAGLMSVFYNQVTSQSKLTALKRKHKRAF